MPFGICKWIYQSLVWSWSLAFSVSGCGFYKIVYNKFGVFHRPTRNNNWILVGTRLLCDFNFRMDIFVCQPTVVTKTIFHRQLFFVAKWAIKEVFTGQLKWNHLIRWWMAAVLDCIIGKESGKSCTGHVKSSLHCYAGWSDRPQREIWSLVVRFHSTESQMWQMINHQATHKPPVSQSQLLFTHHWDSERRLNWACGCCWPIQGFSQCNFISSGE